MILVDGDACPVRNEVYRVASRYRIPVKLVTNSFIRVPADPLIERILVSDAFDAADDWIAEHTSSGCIIITADILLADRCIKAGAAVIAPNGRTFDGHSIGNAIATRALMADLRAMETIRGGPPPFTKEDRSRFLSSLDQAAIRLIRSTSQR